MGAQEEKHEKEIHPPKEGERTACEALSAVVTSAPLAGWDRTGFPRFVPYPVLPSNQHCKGRSQSWVSAPQHTTCTSAISAPTSLCNEITEPGVSRAGTKGLGPSVHLSSKVSPFHFLVIRAEVCQLMLS